VRRRQTVAGGRRLASTAAAIDLAAAAGLRDELRALAAALAA
jgi:hypothetical protein